MLALIILVPILVGSIFAPLIAPHSPTETNAGDTFAGPSSEYPLGTDQFGRDLLSRVLFGIRTSLFLGVTATGLATLFGLNIGIISGYLGGRFDEIVMRTMDALMSFPALLLALLIVSVLPSSLLNVLFAVVIVYTPRIGRVARSQTLSEKNEEYVLAAEARGESLPFIWYGELLPNVIYPILVEATVRVGFAILIVTSMSFLGLGTQPPTPDLGYMVSVGRNQIWSSPWVLIWPSVALSMIILGFNLFGDFLRDVIDPQTSSKSVE
jgi:peptide/nickel transport system permease protein